MAHFGEVDARLTVVGPDEGVDIESAETVVQVKAGGSPTGRPVIQQLYGVAALAGKRPFVFSVAGFTAEALEWADKAGVALFTLDASGAARPANRQARVIFDAAAGKAAGWPAVVDTLEEYAAAGVAVAITARFQLASGYEGFWGIWVDRDGKVRVTRDFAGSATMSVATPADAVDRVARGMRRLGAGFWDSRPVLSVEGNETWFTTGVRPLRIAASTSRVLRVTASDIYWIVANPWCERALYLKERGVEGAPPSAFQQMIIEAGIEHEERYLGELAPVVDLSEGSLADRAAATETAARAGPTTLYQPVLLDRVDVDGRTVEVVGIPDFILVESSGVAIRDTKVALRVTPDERPDITAQLAFYAWLYGRRFGEPAERLEVVAGDGTIHRLDEAAADVAVMDLVATVVAAKAADRDPGCLVKWSSRTSCPYFDRCWNEAVSRGDVVTVPGVTRALAATLAEQGIATVGELLDRMDAGTLAAVEVPRGDRQVKVGSRAVRILRQAKALQRGRPILHGRLDLPDQSTVVMFDLEGVPPIGDEPGGIYLWGIQVMGEQPGTYEPVFAGDGPEGDAEGWFSFLQRAEQIFDALGSDTPFVHWASYERTHLENYIGRYGDPSGVGRKVVENLVDLLKVLRRAVTLPVHSYSLKVVEEYVGFKRSQDEYGGDWSIAVWEEAVVAANPEQRRRLLEKLAAYNAEDLLGMWEVYRWLQRLR